MQPTLELDRKADAAYVRFSEAPVARTKELDEQRIADYDANGEIVGIEFLSSSNGVDLGRLPHRDALERLFGEQQIRQFA